MTGMNKKYCLIKREICPKIGGGNPPCLYRIFMQIATGATWMLADLKSDRS